MSLFDLIDDGVHGPWTDTAGTDWMVLVQDDMVMLRSDEDHFELPAESWQRDIQITPHGAGFVVRFDTFDRAIGFMLTKQQAAPLRRLVGAAPESTLPEQQVEARGPLLWPKVSPLAVWALICAALVFIPLVGIVMAVPTLVLLGLHRKKVRRTRAYSHSRAICLVAFVFLGAGLYTWAVSSWVLLENYRYVSQTAEELEYEGVRLDNPGASGQETQLPAEARAVPPVLAALPDLLQKKHNWGMIAIGIFVILVSLSAHECGHAISAWWLGDDFARRMGRVTLNPLAHIDPVGTVVLPLFLLLSGGPVFGWARPVPVQPGWTDRPRRMHVLVSLAGPGANLLLGAASLLLLLALGATVSLACPDASVPNFARPEFTTPIQASGFALAPVFASICTVLRLSFMLNVLLAIFNLIPIPPLDGSWVVEHSFPSTLGRLYSRIRPFGFLILLGLIFTHVLQYLLFPAIYCLVFAFVVLSWCTFL